MDEPEVILFDLDDTIVDFSWNQSDAWRHTCIEACAEIEADADALHGAIRSAGSAFWADHDRAERGRRDLRAASAEIVSAALAALDIAARADLPREMAERYRARREEGIRLFDGATDVLDALRAAGRRLALITNGTSEEQRGKIERFDLAHHFDHIQIEGEFGLGKPHDAAYRHALASMRADPRTTWFVGDNLEWDVAAPQRHGITGIWVDVHRSGLPVDSAHAPDRVVHRITELIETDRVEPSGSSQNR
ncbi:MAG: HAD family hydrolase [Chloroflexi bacterium]|nr:HAD family hydrolase [Chloroflexota bacterium]MDA1147959.1 HAD family hydrolase [Chloroflexota bacterium]